MKLRRNLFLIGLLTALALVIDAPKNYPVNFSFFGRPISFVITSPTLKLGSWERDLTIKQGLDLRGGTEVILEADMSSLDSADRTDALESAREVISRRVDLYGVTESTVKTSISGDSHRIHVALPGVDNPEQALALIGSTARLDFRELPVATDSALYSDFLSTGLSGSDLKKASVTFSSNTGKPEVSLQFSEAGGAKFAEITGRNIGKPLAIFLDDYPLSAPVVQAKIEGGNAVITGEYTLDEAKNLAITLNAGALPVKITVLSQQNIAPTLGSVSVTKSLRAGGIGLGLVAIFMIFNYGWLGLVADLGLIIYALLTLAIYKLVPITLTLPGLAGFLLSIGMAVDSNILIFERMKEERRKGNNLRESMELGFGKAWDAIKDANIATLMTTFILYNPFEWSFLNSSGLVRGFALTLFLGIAISLFTGIFVTRNLLRASIIKDKL
ncbi:MAG: Preprotein translocase subunit SecD [Microgenomates group bacterium GW2011_GWC1_46_16]|nr:MAG: Preprotein translocase subunit SecD [Microgenomates group bacterium GW2011_GWF1_46_12]KKU26846.1 MAG: Preprotein translocase subunit SecD [Microgenomates group bacterium GW2011_GWC1_46_16]KKU28262.1 MAG: Preprotein translocase subunit SecD [Microgenomates group bacterium GW2011_GWF2_46_18]KKU45485.1 MAG: Preprotein translocase subunit SecD [Microgenomates group bacterium GW2011_GWB1_46_7]KKU62079.1 MAG: Preprotein translocase subunit SecD [Microgenomates group bacterium GW2011_GWE1_47_1